MNFYAYDFHYLYYNQLCILLISLLSFFSIYLYHNLLLYAYSIIYRNILYPCAYFIHFSYCSLTHFYTHLIFNSFLLEIFIYSLKLLLILFGIYSTLIIFSALKHLNLDSVGHKYRWTINFLNIFIFFEKYLNYLLEIHNCFIYFSIFLNYCSIYCIICYMIVR